MTMYWCDHCGRDVPVISLCHEAAMKTYGTCSVCNFQAQPKCKLCGRPIEEY